MQHCLKIKRPSQFCYRVHALQVLNACMWHTLHSAYEVGILNNNQYAFTPAQCASGCPVFYGSSCQIFAPGFVLPRSTVTSPSETLSAQALLPVPQVTLYSAAKPIKVQTGFHWVSTQNPAPALLSAGFKGQTALPQAAHMDSPLWPDMSLHDSTHLPCSMPPSMLFSRLRPLSFLNPSPRSKLIGLCD